MKTNTTRDYDLHDHLAAGRRLRSEAFLDAFAAIGRLARRLAGKRGATSAKGLETA
ncbi:MAG: hypothetical protein AAGF90_04390 [Pseudomonadota bacterium]